MAWPKGKPRPKNAGRKKGTPNKRSQEALEIFRQQNFNPLIRMIKQARETKDESIRASLLRELAQYAYPKRKAIEHSGPDGGPIEFEVRAIDYFAAITPVTEGPEPDSQASS